MLYLGVMEMKMAVPVSQELMVRLFAFEGLKIK
jgi:hypothetical protein